MSDNLGTIAGMKRMAEDAKALGAWRYESDGERNERTHYAVRDSADQPCGEERMDFNSADAAREFVRKSNALIFKLMNGLANT